MKKVIYYLIVCIVIPFKVLSQTQITNLTATASAYTSGYPAANVIDGNTSTSWSTTSSGYQWVQLEMSNLYIVSSVTMNWSMPWNTAKIQLIRNSIVIKEIPLANYAGNTTITVNTVCLEGINKVKIYSYSLAPGMPISLGEVKLYGEALALSYTYDDMGNRTQRKTVKLSTIKSTLADNSKPEEPVIENTGKEIITIFPNPTKGQLLVDIKNLEPSKNTNILVYSSSGKLISELKTVSPINVIDISNQTNGIYILKVIIGEKVYDWKVIKE